MRRPRASEIQQAIAKDEIIILTFSDEATKKTYVLLVTDKKMVSYDVAINSDHLFKLVAELRDLLIQTAQTPNIQKVFNISSAYQLHKNLLQPGEHLLMKKSISTTFH